MTLVNGSTDRVSWRPSSFRSVLRMKVVKSSSTSKGKWYGPTKTEVVGKCPGGDSGDFFGSSLERPVPQRSSSGQTQGRRRLQGGAPQGRGVGGCDRRCFDHSPEIGRESVAKRD